MTRPVGDSSSTALVAGFATLAVTLDAAVNIAFPAISAAFGVPATTIQWVVIAYILAFSALLIPAGHVADRRGHRRVLGLGLVVSAAAYLVCGVAPTFDILLAGRALQGVGAALIFGSAPALVTLGTPELRRGRALGAFSVVGMLGMILGPLLGGVLVGVFGWRVVYLARVPLAALALALVTRRMTAEPAMPEMARARSRLAGPSADRRTLLLAGGTNLLANLAFFSIWLLGPYYLLEGRRLAVGVGGVLLTLPPLLSAAATLLAGRLVDRRAARWLTPLGPALLALGLALTGRLDPASSPGRIAAALGLAGAGIGLFVVPNMRDMMAALPRGRQGVAGSLFALMRTVGIVLGASATTLVYQRRLAAHGAGPGAFPAAAFAETFAVMAVVALAAALLGLVPLRAVAAPRARL